MSKRFLVNIDLQKNELQNVAIHNLAVAPATPVDGQIYFNTSDERYYLRQSTGWKDVTGRLDDILTNTNALSITDNGDGTLTIDAGNASGAQAGLMSTAHFNDLTNATSLNTPNTLVERDASGDFAANDLTTNAVIINETIDGLTPLNHAVHKGYVDALVASGTRIIGSIDCSLNPDYPVSVAGDTYYVSVAGRIGGGAGPLIDVGDMIISVVDSLGGTDAAVGSDWIIVEHNITGASETVAGVIEIATQAEVNTGTDDLRAVTPLKLVTYVASQISGGKHGADVGNGAATSIVVNHALGTIDVHVQIKDNSTLELVECDVDITDANNITLTFNVAPAVSAYRVIIES